MSQRLHAALLYRECLPLYDICLDAQATAAKHQQSSWAPTLNEREHSKNLLRISGYCSRSHSSQTLESDQNHGNCNVASKLHSRGNE